MRSSLCLALALAAGGGLLAATLPAAARTHAEVRRTAEGSMVLTGQINIGLEGEVEGFTLDQREKVPANMADFVDRSVKTWRFEPIVRDGKPVHARTQVSIRLLAQPGVDGNDRVTLDAANFGEYDQTSTDHVTSVALPRPVFPSLAQDLGGSGDVMLLVQVGRDGKVMDVIAEQVNLRVVGDERRMQKLREAFARQSVNTARRWTFRAPTTGDAVDEPFWTVRVPVSYDFNEVNRAYGKWNVYIPGPRAKASWRTAEQGEKDLAGLLPAGGVYMADADNGPRLLTPLGG
ncbi:energy transducer TonB [uncultured Stenotrophomonas sp.]|uniref:energy transducer TonB n=1 Tax=uncultured Stenotrophomonas sp. TaxID=165438 RepID=UPI0028ECE225|nr:energy transducer TonB [uncultured Stenotrophomonas sp.]